jgi:hypothetical protein
MNIKFKRRMNPVDFIDNVETLQKTLRFEVIIIDYEAQVMAAPDETYQAMIQAGYEVEPAE